MRLSSAAVRVLGNIGGSLRVPLCMLLLRRHAPLLTHSTRLCALVMGVAAHIRDGSGSLQIVSGLAAAEDDVDYDNVDYEKMDVDRRAVAASSGLAGHSTPSASSPSTRAQGVGTLGRDVARRLPQPDSTGTSGDPPVDYLPLGNTQIGTSLTSLVSCALLFVWC